MSNVAEEGGSSARTDRQLALAVLPIAFVAGMVFLLWQATFPNTVQVTVCEKVVSSSNIRLLDGRTLDVGKAVYDSLIPLTTYVVEDRWFREPVFTEVAIEQEGFLCWNAL